MDEITRALHNTKTVARKKITHKKPIFKDLFPEVDPLSRTSTFDILDKVKVKKKRPYDIKNWSNDDFLRFMKDSVPVNVIGVNRYDKNLMQRLSDKITSNLVNLIGEDSSCDNKMLKTYLDWWISVYLPVLNKNKTVVSTQKFCDDKCVVEFFKTDLWMPTENPQLPQVLLKSTKPSGKTYEELYYAGGLKKMIYDAGVVNSYIFLITKKNRNHVESIKEIKKTLFSLSVPVLQHVIEKTFKIGPYDRNYIFDVKETVKSCLIKNGLDNFTNLDYNNLFTKEN